MFSRNWLFISEATQKTLSDQMVLIVGTGLGSKIAELAVRTGFKKFIIADGDQVELSNLNRQNFNLESVGQNKAAATKEALLKINPDAQILDLPAFFDQEDLERWVPRANFVINTIDFENDSFRHCSQICRKYEKIELFPTNLGFGGSLVAFNSKSPTFSEFFKTEDSVVLKKKILEYLILNKKAPTYMKEAYSRYLLQKVGKPDPQLGIGAAMTSALTVTTMVRVVSGETIKTFPQDFYYVDGSY
jgi:hypothetical protein